MNLTKQIKENFIFFKKELLPYNIVLKLKDDVIVVNINKSTLMHLLGIQKSKNPKFQHMEASYFYEYIEKTINDEDDYNVVSQQDIDDDNVDISDGYIVDKNYFFIKLFNSLLYETNVRFFKKAFESDFKADYVQYKQFGFGGGYIGLIGGNDNDFYYFNSIQYIRSKADKYKGEALVVYSVERVLKNNFKLSDYKLKPSIHNKMKLSSDVKSKKKENKAVKGIDYKKMKNMINKMLPIGYEIKNGEFSKKSVQVYYNGMLQEAHLEEKIFTQSVTDVVDYISKNYPK